MFYRKTFFVPLDIFWYLMMFVRHDSEGKVRKRLLTEVGDVRSVEEGMVVAKKDRLPLVQLLTRSHDFVNSVELGLDLVLVVLEHLEEIGVQLTLCLEQGLGSNRSFLGRADLSRGPVSLLVRKRLAVVDLSLTGLELSQLRPDFLIGDFLVLVSD